MEQNEEKIKELSQRLDKTLQQLREREQKSSAFFEKQKVKKANQQQGLK